TARHVSAWAGIVDLRDSNASLNLHDLKERYEIDAARRRDLAAAYVQEDWTLSSRWTATGGFRLERDGLTGERLASPRAAPEWRASPRSVWRATAAVMHGLRDKPMEILPTASGRPVGAEESREATLGWVGQLTPRCNVGLSGYLKRESHLVYQSSPALYANGGEGRATGLELWGRLEPRPLPLRSYAPCT